MQSGLDEFVDAEEVLRSVVEEHRACESEDFPDWIPNPRASAGDGSDARSSDAVRWLFCH